MLFHLWEHAHRLLVNLMIPDWLKDLLPLYVGMGVFVAVILLVAHLMGEI